MRVVKTYFRVLQHYAHCGDYDVLMVGYPGYLDVFLAWIVAKIRKKPLAWDVLNSLYLMVSERGIAKHHPVTAALLRTIERWACLLPDMLFLDTERFVEWFGTTYDIPPERFRLIPIGVDERKFAPLEKTVSDDIFRVVYYGTYIPNHGVETIVKAAKLLEDDKHIHFEMIGSGPEETRARETARNLKVTNIRFIGWLEQPELTRRIANADLILGAFGTTQQLELTNNNKIYEGFAMLKPVISGDTPALPHVLKHKVHLYLCKRGNPQSLANGIRELRANPSLCQEMAANGKRIVHEYFDITAIGQRVAMHIRELAGE